MPARLQLWLRITLAIGFCIDFFVGLLALFGQPLIQPLLDMPVRDPAMTAILGGELIVASGIYVLAFRDPRRWRPLLWLCALDQTLGVLIPAVTMVYGLAPATFKTIAPMPFQLALVAFYIYGATAALPGRVSGVQAESAREGVLP
jgi:hypothetical protein